MIIETRPNHTYNTRQSNEPRRIHTNYVSTNKILRYYLQVFIKDIPSNIKNLVYTNSLKSVKYRFKQYMLSSYKIECTIQNCYVCEND